MDYKLPDFGYPFSFYAATRTSGDWNRYSEQIDISLLERGYAAFVYFCRDVVLCRPHLVVSATNLLPAIDDLSLLVPDNLANLQLTGILSIR
jgi:hypothetical protein